MSIYPAGKHRDGAVELLDLPGTGAACICPTSGLQYVKIDLGSKFQSMKSAKEMQRILDYDTCFRTDSRRRNEFVDKVVELHEKRYQGEKEIREQRAADRRAKAAASAAARTDSRAQRDAAKQAHAQRAAVERAAREKRADAQKEARESPAQRDVAKQARAQRAAVERAAREKRAAAQREAREERKAANQLARAERMAIQRVLKEYRAERNDARASAKRTKPS